MRDLEVLFPRIISKNQSGFVKRRSIFENVLLRKDSFRYQIEGQTTNDINKLDMSKIYDKVF